MSHSILVDILRTAARSYAVVVLVALLTAAAVVPVVQPPTDEEPTDAVAVVPIEGTITTDRAENIAWILRNARQRDDIKAVVLQVNSPGGGAAASEHLYAAVLRTSKQMPVIATVESTGASGAYYAMLPAEEIFVTPASIVGSVGVRSGIPSGGIGREIASGPDKTTGGTVEETRNRVETLQRIFVGAVMTHRGDRLSLSRREVANAKVYDGTQAVKNGMADRIGVLDDAIQVAADRAGLEEYIVVHTRLGPGQRLHDVGLSAEPGSHPETTTETRIKTGVREESDPFGFEGVDSPTYLMVWGEVESSATNATDGAGSESP